MKKEEFVRTVTTRRTVCSFQENDVKDALVHYFGLVPNGSRFEWEMDGMERGYLTLVNVTETEVKEA